MASASALSADLLLLEAMLKANRALSATAVVNKSPISNNANVATLRAALRDLEPWAPRLHSARFTVLAEDYGLPTLDLRFASEDLLNVLTKASHIFVKGASFFEKLQYLPTPSFYLFRTYSRMSCALSGLEKGSGVFARVEANARCFGTPVRCGDTFVAAPNLARLRLFDPVFQKKPAPGAAEIREIIEPAGRKTRVVPTK